MVRITTGEPVSANVLTPTHSHERARRKHTRRQRDGALPEAHGLSMKHRQLPESAKTTKREEELWRQSSSTSSSAKCDPHSVPFPLLVKPKAGGTLQPLTSLYSLSLRTKILLDFLPTKYALPRIFTSADLHLTMYNISKLVPACKGRFAHIILRFRLGTVFSTTT